MARPPRIPHFDYVGPLSIFFTITTRSRRRAFADADVARHAIDQMMRTAAAHRTEVTAYCVMPDHVHLLARGLDEHARLITAVVRWKQAVGWWYRQRHSEFLWQEGYWERVMRRDDDVLETVHYIVANPWRAGLVTDVADYPWIGASRWTIAELATACMDARRPSWWARRG